MFNVDEFFGLEKEVTTTQRKFDAVSYFSAKFPGIYVIRLFEKFTPLDVHFLPKQRVSVLCLGADCPVCARNNILFHEYGSEAVLNSDFIARQRRYVANIVDRTPSVVCPACGESVYKFLYKANMPCPQCGAAIPPQAETVVLDKVRLASFSKTFVEQLKVIATSVYDNNGNLKPITDFDIKIISAIVNGKTQLSPFPSDSVSEPPAIAPNAVFPHEKIAIKFSKEELLSVMHGAHYRDVLKARDTTTTTIPATEGITLDDSLKSEAENIVNVINEMFS